MKRVLLVLMATLWLLSACGGGGEEDNEPVKEDQEQAVEMDIDSGKESTVVKVEDGTEIEVVHDDQKSLEVPKDYPMDLMPVYSEEFIASVQTNPDGSFGLVGQTKDDLAKVQAFYEEHLEGAKNLMTQKDVDFFMSSGDIEGSAYTVMLEMVDDEEEPFKTTFILQIMPGQPMMESTDEGMDDTEEEASTDDDEKSMVEAPIVVPDGLTVPDAYPSDIMPFYPTGNTELASGMDGMVALMSEDAPEHVIVFYKEKFKDAKDLSEMNMAPTSMLMGTIEGKYFQVIIGPNEGQEEERFKTLVQVVYE